MEAQKLGLYTLKTYGYDLYTWTPERSFIKTNLHNQKNKKYYCNASVGSQGEDWVTGYAYDLTINQYNGLIQRIAYVECDYVV